LEELKIKNIGATIFNIKNVAITINTLFILLKTFKVFFPALCKFEGNYGDFIIYILKYCCQFILIPIELNKEFQSISNSIV
jgi:hypothetical protein